jgi:catalase
MTDRTPLMTHATGTPVVDNTNIMTACPRGPALLQDIWLIEAVTTLSAPNSTRTSRADR